MVRVVVVRKGGVCGDYTELSWCFVVAVVMSGRRGGWRYMYLGGV